MGIFNEEIGEVVDIIQAFAPQDVDGAVTSDWVHAAHCDRIGFLVNVGDDAAGDFTITLTQATDNTGAGSKALNFTRVRAKINATSSGAVIVAELATPTNVFDTADAAFTAFAGFNGGGGNTDGIVLIEVLAADLDANTAGAGLKASDDPPFAWVNAAVITTGATVRIASCQYLLAGAKYPAEALLSSI